MIVDAHVHLYPPQIQATWEHIATREPYFGALAQTSVHKWAQAEDLIARMDADGVDCSWVCGFGFQDMGLCRECNDYVLDAASRYPGRIVPLAVVPPLHREVEEEVLRCREAGCLGVGEIFPTGQGWSLTDIRQTWPLAGICFETGMLLLVHTAEPVGHAYPGKGAEGPREAVAFCEHHPEVSVVFAHWGGGLWLYELMPELRVLLANAWYDTAATPFLYAPEIFAAAMAAGVGHKVLYGSDFPILGRDRYDRMLDKTSLSSGQREALLGRNAEALRRTLLAFREEA